MPLAPPREPTDEQRNTILERCKAAIDEQRDPLAVLTAEEHGLMLNLHIINPTGARVMLAHLRDHAIHNETVELRWTERRAQRIITFAAYEQGARLWREAQAQVARNTNVRSLAEAREARRGRPRGPLASLDPAEMRNMNSMRARGVGLLRALRAGRIWNDEFYKKIMVDWDGTSNEAVIPNRVLTIEFRLNVALWMIQMDEKLGNASDQQVSSWIETMSNDEKRSEPRDWLNTLTWDGTERLRDVMVRGFGAVDSQFNIEVGRCWFVGMVARIMRPGCQLDTMPVLIGPQGIFKSQALRVIGGDWYRAAVSDIHSKDFKQELHGAMVFEIPELHSLVTSNAAAAKVKAVISNQVDHFRAPYRALVEEHRRTCVMCGTTNSRDWHHDESGARRFWPVHCGDIDLEWLRENRAQLFAEARAYFDLPPLRIPLEGDDYVERRDPRSMWWNVPEAEQRAAMEDETSEDVWQGMIEGKLNGTEAIWNDDPAVSIQLHDGSLSESADWGNLLTTARIAYSWLQLNSTEAGKRVTSNRIGSIMRNLGWHRIMKRLPNSNVRHRIWLNPDAPAPSIFTNPGTVDDADIPF